MRMTSLPPLDALRGFVTAARRKSITAAAEELCLTQSAISRQIQALEERLGTPLFIRKHRTIILTDTGEQLYKITLPWLEQLAEFSERVRAEPKTRPVTVSASIGVAALWLLPRLGDFQAAHPDIDIRLAANNRMLDLDKEGIDLAIRYCGAGQAPQDALRLADEVIVPVASPAVAATAFLSGDALLEHTLLDLDDHGHAWHTWGNWLREHGFRQRKPKRTLHFNQYDQVIQAALAGHGVALGRMALVNRMLQTGQLVAHKGHAVTVPGYAYWLIGPSTGPRRDVEVFRQWLLRELIPPASLAAA